MLGRILKRAISLRHRYRDSHFRLQANGREIFDQSGIQVGYVDSILVKHGYLNVTGWVRGVSKVTLIKSGQSVFCKPTLYRPDVAAAYGGSASTGFQLTVFCPPSGIRRSEMPGLVFEMQDAASRQIPPIPLPIYARFFAGLMLDAKLIRSLVSSHREIWSWVSRRDNTSRDALIEKMGLTIKADQVPLESALFHKSPPSNETPSATRITIILPVYNAFDLLPDVLERVLKHTDLPYHLIILDDASPDERVGPWLREKVSHLQNTDRTHHTLIENETNLGFVRSVNRGIAVALSPETACPADLVDGPIVLLNADAFVPPGWASRLIAPILQDAKTATVTPFSNDAEIFSVPEICNRSDLAQGQADALDAIAQRFAPDALENIAPTGVGFCMAIGRDWLRKVGDLDTIFGRGYGEEVDWCQRARALGGLHVCAINLFVEHRGGSSFGSAAKQALIQNNNGIVRKRYPTYDAEVQDFIAKDTLITARLALAIGLAGLRAQEMGGQITVYLGHSLGGGAEVYLRNRIADDITHLGAAVVLRVGGTHLWQIELHTASRVTARNTDDTNIIAHMLSGLPARTICYSCGVGHRNPSEIPTLLTSLTRATDRLQVLVHDFFMVSPSYTLIGSDGIFHGAQPTDRAVRDDPMHQSKGSDGKTITLDDWQEKWGTVMTAADEITVFSDDSARQILKVWPSASATIKIVPHLPRVRPDRLDTPELGAADPAIILGVLGGINLAKGAAVLQEIAERIRDKKLNAGLVLIGEIDPAFTLPSPAVVHGKYAPDHIAQLAARYRITHWLIPSVWPETFSFTTHEALATGLPVLAFDIGAQGDEMRKAANGHAVAIPSPSANSKSNAGNLVESLIEHIQNDLNLQISIEPR